MVFIEKFSNRPMVLVRIPETVTSRNHPATFFETITLTILFCHVYYEIHS